MTINEMWIKKVKNKFIFLAICFVYIAICGRSVYAEDKEYSIPKAEFDVVFNEDGDATVTELWELKFEKGEFSRFYKDISTTELPKDENFEEISDISVFTGGKECKYTEDYESRPDYCYHNFTNKPGDTIEAYVKSVSPVRRSFKFQYTLKNVVKCVDQDYNLFVYRFVGANFGKDIDNIKVTIHPPKGAQCQILYQSGGEYTDDNETLIFKESYCYGMYKIRIRMDGVTIPGAEQISSEDLSERDDTYYDTDYDTDTEKVDNDSGNNHFILVVLGVLVSCIALILCGGIFLTRMSMIRELEKKGLRAIEEKVEMFSGMSLTPMELIALGDEEFWPFVLQVISLASKGVIQYHYVGDEMYITIPKNAKKKLADKVDQQTVSYCNSLIKKMNREEQNRSISIYELSDLLLGDVKYAKKINQRLRKTLYKNALSKINKDMSIEERGKNLHDQLKYADEKEMLPKISVHQLMEYNFQVMDVLYYHYNNSHRHSDIELAAKSDMRLDDNLFWQILYYNNYLAHTKYKETKAAESRGGSTGFSCSSCSSCSSCGGGGAD